MRLPEDEHNALRLYSFLSGTSLNETVVAAIREFLTSREEEVFERGIDRIRKQYRVALDKLADL